MRRDSVATLRVRHIDATWGLRNVLVKGGKTRDIPLPGAVTQFLLAYVDRMVTPEVRTTERAAHLVEAVLPWVPVRQWVLTVPYRLRYRWRSTTA